MRPITARPIEARLKSNEFIEAGPHDFRLGAPEPAPERHWSPYATSPDGRTMWWAGMPGPLHRADEPFYYLAQYRGATHLAEAATDALPSAARATRTLLFSVGRCGSTLVGDVARTGGLTCLSEPDAITPFALSGGAPAGAASIYARVLDASLEGWKREAASDRALVKLRAQHSNAAHLRLAVDALEEPGFVFLFREPRTWARSMAGHFGLPVERLLALYGGPLHALRAARGRGLDPPVLLYETLTGSALAAALGLDAAPDLPERSSQAGTRLAGLPPTNEGAERTVAAFMAAWPSLGARDLDLPY